MKKVLIFFFMFSVIRGLLPELLFFSRSREKHAAHPVEEGIIEKSFQLCRPVSGGVCVCVCVGKRVYYAKITVIIVYGLPELPELPE